MKNIFNETILTGDTDGSEEIVIALVGAIGCNLSVVQNVLKSSLEDVFNFDTQVIKVSSDILSNHPITKSIAKIDLSCPYSRAQSLMDVGNKLREHYGSDYISLEIASRIRTKRKSFSGEKKRIAYIVNSLKHDGEISTLRKIYGSSFFQISVFESAFKREATLVNNIGMKAHEAKSLMARDEKESNDWGQRTSVAFPLADYFVKFDDKEDIHIKNAVNRFIGLILGNPFITPTFSESAIYMAFMSGLRSADLSRQVGAVIAKDENILSTGTNDVPKFGGGIYYPKYRESDGLVYDIENGRDYKRGNDCNHVHRDNLVQGIFENIKKDLNGVLSEDIPNDKKILDKIRKSISSSELKDITEFGRMVHAEMDAILNCARSNNSTTGSILYVTTFPCHNCAKHIISSGIKEVIFVEPYPKSKALRFHDDSITLDKNETEKLRFKPFVGVGPRNFINLFSMTLGLGSEMIRKSKDGNKVNWNEKNAKLRIRPMQSSYKNYESKAEEYIIEIMDNFGS